MIAIAIFVRENDDEMQDLFESNNMGRLFWTVIGSGTLLIIISLLGCVGVKNLFFELYSASNILAQNLRIVVKRHDVYLGKD